MGVTNIMSINMIVGVNMVIMDIDVIFIKTE